MFTEVKTILDLHLCIYKAVVRNLQVDMHWVISILYYLYKS